MEGVKRNAEIVALVKARKMPRRKIAARYGLNTISRIAICHGVRAKALDPNMLRVASKLIRLGMPLTHVAETVGVEYKRLRHLLGRLGLYKVPPPNGKPWSERELRVLRRDYGKPKPTLRTIAATLGRTRNAVSSKASQLGLSWPPELRASSANIGRRPTLSGHQQTEALERLAAGESYRAVARTLGMHHGTIARLTKVDLAP